MNYDISLVIIITLNFKLCFNRGQGFILYFQSEN